MCKKNKEELTKNYNELAKKYEKLEETMQFLLNLESISSASRIFSQRRRAGFLFETVVCFSYLRYGELYTQEIFTNFEIEPIVPKVVDEDICSAIVELVIGEKDAKEIVYLLVDKQKKTVTDITRWYKNEEKK